MTAAPSPGASALVSTEWLAEHLQAPDVRVVDGSWYLPTEGLDPRQEYEAHHIPGAVFFDIDEIADTSSPLPHMLPSPEKFSSRVRKLGLGDGVRIVVYDQRGIYSAPRVWWTFRVFGHQDVVVLDGGLRKWMAEGKPVATGTEQAAERHFSARVDTTLVRELDQVRRDVESGRRQLVDARPPERFEGRAAEPRPGVRSGHMPGARNLPFAGLIDPESGTLEPAETLAKRFDEAGVDRARPIVTTCGSGITAAILALALHELGRPDAAVYDGSWVEWGQAEDAPVATGPA